MDANLSFCLLWRDASPNRDHLERGARRSGAIYVTGFNLGVTRYLGRTTPGLRKLQPRLPGWFVHTAGFLA